MCREKMDAMKMSPLVALMIFLLAISQNIVSTNQSEMQRTAELFASRTPADWRQVWHHERHQRCYSELVGHMDWVCRNDIYRAANKRRETIDSVDSTKTDDGQGALGSSSDSGSTKGGGGSGQVVVNVVDTNIFLTREVASNILSSRTGSSRHQRAKRGIMDECCSSNGCSWEEYAEYCPTNRRTRTRNLP